MLTTSCSIPFQNLLAQSNHLPSVTNTGILQIKSHRRSIKHFHFHIPHNWLQIFYHRSDYHEQHACPTLFIPLCTSETVMMIPASLELAHPPALTKHHIVHPKLREPVQKMLEDLVSEVLLTPMSSAIGATSIVTPVRRNRGNPEIRTNHHIDLNRFLKTDDVCKSKGDLN